MEWQIDNNKPVYIQLVEQLKMKIISGEIDLDSKSTDSKLTVATNSPVSSSGLIVAEIY